MIKKLICIVILFCNFIVNSQDFGIVTPEVQSVSGESPGSFFATINLNNTITGVTPHLTIVSGDETGFHFWIKNRNEMNIIESISLQFQKTVTEVEESTYELRLESYFNEDVVISNFTVHVTFYPENSCQLAAPNIEFTEITESSANINFINTLGNDGYDFTYGAVLNSNPPPYVYGSTSSSLDISDLLPNTTYLISAHTLCSTGFRGGYNREFFHTLPVCESDIIVTDDVHRFRTDNRLAEFTITATNKIFEGEQVIYDSDYKGGVANYNAGERVLLKPGFHAMSGSAFRAFIEGCSSTSSSTSSSKTSQEKNSSFVQDNNTSLKLYPNPTTGLVNILSTDNVVSWQLNNSFG